MSNHQENTAKVGKIDPEKNLPDFLTELAGKILHVYDGETHGCLSPNEIAIAIQEKPGIFYGVPFWLIIWGAA